MNENVLRVFKNVEILLRTGVFSGEAAAALAEAQGLVKATIANVENEIEQAKATGHSADSEASAGRVVGSRVRRPRRKSGGDAADGA